MPRNLNHGVPAHALELEITESVIMIDPERAAQVLDSLRRLGLRLAVDDYGTGYCALANLRDLPVHELNIDRSINAPLNPGPPPRQRGAPPEETPPPRLHQPARHHPHRPRGA